LFKFGMSLFEVCFPVVLEFCQMRYLPFSIIWTSVYAINCRRGRSCRGPQVILGVVFLWGVYLLALSPLSATVPGCLSIDLCSCFGKE
jgi:hypothetical protein